MRVLANKTWLIADTHFGHMNIIKFCARPFKDVAEMNAVITHNINSKVHRDDLLIVVGDYSFRPQDYLDNITCNNVVFLKGNHDADGLKAIKRANIKNWKVLDDSILELKVYLDPNDRTKKVYAILCHYPMLEWDKSRHGSYHFHGHCHYNLNEFEMPVALRMDIGVDANYRRDFSKFTNDPNPTSAARDITKLGPIKLIDAIDEVDKRVRIQRQLQWRSLQLSEMFTGS